MKNITLQDFLCFLDENPEATFQGDEVTRYLTGHRIRPDAWEPFAYFRADTYGRNLVIKTKYYELIVLTWLPHQRTPIHDHAGQRCWMALSQGMLCFRNYASCINSSPLQPCGTMEQHSAGDAVYIDDGIGVHSIANSSREPAISIHLYAAPIPRCRIYDESQSDFRWVDLEYHTVAEALKVRASG